MAKSPPNQSDSQTEQKPLPPKRRNWRRRFVVLSSILLILGWLANGPVARWALRYGIEEAMASIGMKGSVSVKGTVLSGLSLRDLNYSGDEGIESIFLKQLDLDYKVRELLEGKIRGLDVQQVDLVIDYAKFPESEEADDVITASLRESLASLRPYLTSPRINLADVRVTLLNDGNQSVTFKLGALKHDAGSGIYQLREFQASDAKGTNTPIQGATLTWLEKSATIQRLEILPDIVLEKLSIDWAEILRGEAELLIDGAALDLAMADKINIKLNRGKIRSDFLNEKFSLDLPASFVIDSLHTDIYEWEREIPHWRLAGKISLVSLRFDDYFLQNTSIEFQQKDTSWKLQLSGQVNGADIQSAANGSWTDPSATDWWGDTKLNYELKSSKLATLAKPWLPEDIMIDLGATTLDFKGDAELRKLELTHATAHGFSAGTKVNDTSMPYFSVNASYHQNGLIDATLNFGQTGSPHTTVSGKYHLNTGDYEGTLDIDEADPTWLNAIATAFDVPVILEKNVQFKWTGKGNVDFKEPQTGNLNIESLSFTTPDAPQFQLKGKASYDWPQKAAVENFEIRERDWRAKTNLMWDGKTLNLETLSLSNKGEAVANLSGKIPLTAEINSAADFFDQTQPWELNLKSRPLALKKLNDWFSLEPTQGITGSASMDLLITGSPNSPHVNGNAALVELTGLDAAQRDSINASISFRSEGQLLHIETTVKEGRNERLTGAFTLPFEPGKLIRDPDIVEKWLDSATLNGTASINTLPLERFSRFVPELKKIQGSVSGTAKLSGTLSKPRYTLDIQGKSPLIQLRNSDLGDIREVKLTATIDETQKVRANMTAHINGGKFEITGTADLTDSENPEFDLTVVTRYALAYRDDMVSVRANGDLRIRGTLTDATISGKIGLVESLFYKDMELIPIGVPASEVAKVQLPALDAEKAANGLPVPEPFGNWKLDVTIATTDPVLIRGNVAKGQISGALKIGGTLSDPKPNGKLLAQDVTAKLPFSILKVKRGEIRFTPEGGLDPILNVRGTSTVGSHDVSVFVYGRASSPKTTLSSFPPLPESEIMSLLGTGTTTSGLQDRDVATFKAFQIFLMKLKKRAAKPGGNRLFKNLLEGVDDLNLNVGEKDRFTGRKFSSATIELHPRWHLTAQVDAQQQTRGLIVYVIRFR